jgi:hypothetical protein
MSNSRRQILKGVAALLGGLTWLGAATTAIADPIAFYLTATINWVSDFPFVPSTVYGVEAVSTDVRPVIFSSFFENVDPLAGPLDLSPQSGFLPINPGETIFWSFSGQLSSGGYTYPICAYTDFAIPSGPCGAIQIATLMSDNFGEISLTGAVFAFDGTAQDPVRIGTWKIHSRQFSVPEPATLALLAVGLAGFGFSRRKQ